MHANLRGLYKSVFICGTGIPPVIYLRLNLRNYCFCNHSHRVDVGAAQILSSGSNLSHPQGFSSVFG
ncbi:MAG TPA: hypothetical protein DCS91_00130 [Microcoleaceae bacterium UBA11344]|nr:hypothetical protein [Microcoleaceae cyanobacterium UBA11344]